jgi:hypothetical protein
LYVTDSFSQKDEIAYLTATQTEIPLGVRIESGAAVSLQFEGMENLPDASVYLLDKETGKRQNLRDDPCYAFVSTNASLFNNRFVLEIGTSVPAPATESTLSIYRSDNRLTVGSPKEIRSVDLYDVQGRRIAQGVPAGAGFTVPVTGLQGVYIVKTVFADGEMKTGKVVVD